MNKHNQTAVFYQEKWDMQFGHSSQLFEQGLHKYVAKNFNQSFSNTCNRIHTPFAQAKTKQNRWQSLLLSMTSRRKIKKNQKNSQTDNPYAPQDILPVVQRMTQDLKMMIESAEIREMYNINEAQIIQCCDDIQILAERGYLQYVDVCLMNVDQGHRFEQSAYRFEMNATENKLRTNRPNSVFISNLDKRQPALRIVMKYTANFTCDAQINMDAHIFAPWKAAYCDISHQPLRADIDRDYSCNGYAIQRKVFC
ncbi:MAG: hypothetical protein H7Z73_02610 [Candidatus Saccharibacteria bacterium]|nr:hypothetical protein [Moraxellaceae bacterium]